MAYHDLDWPSHGDCPSIDSNPVTSGSLPVCCLPLHGVDPQGRLCTYPLRKGMFGSREDLGKYYPGTLDLLRRDYFSFCSKSY